MEKKVDARLNEIRKEQFELAEEKSEVVGKGPGSYDECIGYLELFKCLAFLALFFSGIFIGTSSAGELANCNQLKTQNGIDFCTYNYLNVSATQQRQCLAIDASGCCDSVSDSQKSESDRQACMQELGSSVTDTSVQCLSNSAFESNCKDPRSCPKGIVSAYQNSIILFSVTLLVFSFIEGLRGYGLVSYASIHYLDFFERKPNCWEKTILCFAKLGTVYEQFFFVLIHLPALIWLIYNQEGQVAKLCGDAKNQDGDPWELPRDGASWLLACVIFEGFLLIFSTITRMNYVIRPELYNPQQQGYHECYCCGWGPYLKILRSEKVCTSSIWCGNLWYTKKRQYFKKLCGKCGTIWIGYVICWGPIWFFIYLSNVIFWLTLGALSCFCDWYKFRAHWIGI
mmetsp:Transcript_1156/g.1972  ORF Transcript_1156/g.1972 Transcript_1156/m.1972 type:complete len:398 (+) Transcript_1156:474-1667(+)